MGYALLFLFYLGSGLLTSYLAGKRGRSKGGWFVAGFVFPLFSLIALYVMPPLDPNRPDNLSGRAPIPPRQTVPPKRSIPSSQPAPVTPAAQPAQASPRPTSPNVLAEDLIVDDDRMMARASFVVRVIASLDADSRLQEMFGTPVSDSLLLLAEDGDIRIVENGRNQLSQDDQEYFLETLDTTLSEQAR